MHSLVPVSTSILILAMATMGAGCHSTSTSQYVSPKITGRVVDARTHEALENARVQRLHPDDSMSNMPAPGGEAMEAEADETRTQSDGTFILESKRDLGLFQHESWYSVSLLIKHPGYRAMKVSYSITDATNSPAGEPWIRTGDLLLSPSSP